ncbi:hypothetical protein D3C86_1589040 [compost metagenome]
MNNSNSIVADAKLFAANRLSSNAVELPLTLKKPDCGKKAPALPSYVPKVLCSCVFICGRLLVFIALAFNWAACAILFLTPIPG